MLADRCTLPWYVQSPRRRAPDKNGASHWATARTADPPVPASDPREVVNGQRTARGRGRSKGPPGSRQFGAAQMRRSVAGGLAVFAAVTQLEQHGVAHTRVEAEPILLPRCPLEKEEKCRS